MVSAPPLTITVTRGNAVESSHRVHIVLLDGQGRRRATYGNPELRTYPRSSLKPLQALALVESGAAEAFGLTGEELALSCASHSGEEKHTTRVAAWLGKLSLDETALGCGAHAPYADPCAPPSVLCNNCSGKHSGMLTLSCFLKVDPAGYTDPRHPAQRRILDTVGEMCGAKISPESCGIDGCSAPNPLLTLEQFAVGLARFMNPASASLARGAACRLLFQAMTEHPDLVAGTGRLDTALMRAAGGKIMAKGGGEAAYALIVPGKDTVAAFKCEDGASRAVHAAVHAVLEKHALADAPVLEDIAPLSLPVLKNWRGLETGRTEYRFG